MATRVNVLHPGDKVNEEHPKVPRTYSSFPGLSGRFAHTCRYGEYSPNRCEHVLASDGYQYRDSHMVDSYTLRSPLKSDIKHVVQTFCVPMEAILVHNWDKIYTPPVVGDDISDPHVNTVDPFFFRDTYAKFATWANVYSEYFSSANSDDYITDEILTNIFRFALFMEQFFSAGSLINFLGCNLSGSLRVVASNILPDQDADDTSILCSFDQWFDAFCRVLLSKVNYFGVDEYNQSGSIVRSFQVYLTPRPDQLSGEHKDSWNLRSFLQFARENSFWRISSIHFIEGEELIVSDLSEFFYNSVDGFTPFHFEGQDVDTDDKDALSFNYDVAAAYQLICHHFYSNDSVDYIYSAELFRQSMRSLIELARVPMQYFTYNGVNTPFDWLSGKYFTLLLDKVEFSDVATFSSFYSAGAEQYFKSLFGFRRQLRFVDYFTGSKSRPIAVGDTSISVNSGVVDVVDVTRSIQRQRFLNAVNRIGRKFEDYIQGMFGVRPNPDYHNPLYLSSTQDVVGSYEVDNTGVAQLTDTTSRTSVIQGAASDFIFKASFDRPAIVISIEHFEIPRSYAHNIERTFFHKDRFDMFNSFLQFTGDRSIYRAEVDSRDISSQPFSYCQQYNEYREKVSRCVGGFVENLPGWILPSDNIPGVPTFRNISPDYIRCWNAEADPFFVKLTGWSLGSYFHFIVISDQQLQAHRPIAYQAQIM